jgi:hypothetical protein
LSLKFVREPNIIRVKKSKIFPASIPEAEVAGCAHPFVDVAGMLEITDPLRVSIGVTPGYGCARVARPVIDQHQLPVGIALGNHALDRLFQEAVGIEENRDDRYQRSCSQTRMRR